MNYLGKVLAQGHELGPKLVLHGAVWFVTSLLQPLGADCHFVWIVS